MTNMKKEARQAHQMTMSLHVRALCCHCECLGMNAANTAAIVQNNSIFYTEESYLQVMRKWGLITPEGIPNLKE